MDWIIETPIDQLPDEVLTDILKLCTDSPVSTRELRAPPISVAASRVSRRWRVVAVKSPELWTTIRLSHRSRSWNCARLFVKRSRSYPLDISINLEAYGNSYGPGRDISLVKALDVVGPHIGRWRTFALRCSERDLPHLRHLLNQSQHPCKLQSAHISLLGGYYFHDTVWPPYALAPLVRGASFYSLRVNFPLEIPAFAAFRAVRSLDIDLGRRYPYNLGAFRLMLDDSSLETLIIRNFVPEVLPAGTPTDCPRVRSLAISFSVPLYYRQSYPDLEQTFGGFDSFTNRFSFPNLEYLEILGGFSGSVDEHRDITVPEEWEAPLFPHLRTLRLEDVGFSPNGLAFIQSFSCGINALELIYTTDNHCLLEQRVEYTPCPALRSLTVETPNGVSDAKWLASFIAMRASLGAHRCILDLTLSPCPGGIALPFDSPPEIHCLHDGPSPALMDGTAGNGFYIDEYDARPKDFEHVQWPEYPDSWWWYLECQSDREYKLSADQWRLEEEIAEAFKATGELVRSKKMCKELRRKKQRDLNHRAVKRSSRDVRSSKRQRSELREDFYLR